MSESDLGSRLSKLSESLSTGVAAAGGPDDSLNDISLENANLEGAVVLGGVNSNRYVTRYRIDREAQRRFVRSQLLAKECMPCTRHGEKGRGQLHLVWDVLRSELFLVTLHISVVILGVLKEALDMRDYDEDLHLVHSIVETFVSCTIVLIRVVSARHGLIELKEYRESSETSSDMSKSMARYMKQRVRMFMALGIILMVLDVAAFFMFKYVPGANLGWTVLTNNFMLILVAAIGGQVLGVMGKEMATLREDQHKAIIYETVLLMTEVAWAQKKEVKQKVFRKAERFCRALQDTELVKQPDYMTSTTATKPSWDLVTSLEVVSMI